jgi:hypothetical protein
VVVVAFVDGILRLVSAGVDECERLAHERLLPPAQGSQGRLYRLARHPLRNTARLRRGRSKSG